MYTKKIHDNDEYRWCRIAKHAKIVVFQHVIHSASMNICRIKDLRTRGDSAVTSASFSCTSLFGRCQTEVQLWE